MIRKLLLDVDGTLLDFNASAKLSLEGLFASRGYKWEDSVFDQYCEINEGLWQQYEKGLLARERVLVDRFTILFERLGISEKGETFEESFRDGLESHAVLVDGAIEILDYLSAKYDLYIVTNGVARTQDRRLALSGLNRYMTDVFISERVGSQKPQKEYFDYCLSHIGPCEKDEVMLIGDSLSADILGANRAGITSVWFNPSGHENPGTAEPDHEIRTLAELKKIL